MFFLPPSLAPCADKTQSMWKYFSFEESYCTNNTQGKKIAFLAYNSIFPLSLWQLVVAVELLSLLHNQEQMHIWAPLGSSPCPRLQPAFLAICSAAEDLDEGPSELDVERGVDHRIEGAVDVAQPSERAVKPGGHVACPAVGVQYVSHKERQPADEEHPWRSAERTRANTRADMVKD